MELAERRSAAGSGSGGMAEGLHWRRGTACALAVHVNPHMSSTLQASPHFRRGAWGGRVASVAGFPPRGCVVSASWDEPSALARGAALFCGWARRRALSAVRWGGQLGCLPTSSPASFDAGEFAGHSVRIRTRFRSLVPIERELHEQKA